MPTVTTSPTERIPVPTWTPTASPTREVQRLILCTREPRAISPFLPSRAGSDLLALFYEEPIERVHYHWQARLVERVPSLTNGDVVTRLVAVTTGMRYMDSLRFVHSYTGTKPIYLPQLIVTFTLKANLRWSDGISITAKDAIFGYHLAQAPEAQGPWRLLVERTARFIAVDERTLRWEGVPGYMDADYPGFLFPLQPAHRWQGKTFSGILDDRTPPATGPFRIVAWESGREVRLERNQYYSGPVPKLKQITVRFPRESPDQWARLLLNGTCDVILPDPILLTSWQQWAKLSSAGKVVLWADVAPVVLRLDLNINPPAMTGASPSTPLRDIRVRRALARCINRRRLTEARPSEAIEAAYGFIPPNHPAYDISSMVPYDPDLGRRLLTEAGWWDETGDGIREAHNIPGFSDGQALTLTMHFVPQHFVVAAHVAADLETCGVKVDLRPTDATQLYASGGNSPLLGRQFQMALIGWQVKIPQVCGAWTRQRIPTPVNKWQGENFSGFSSAEYDAACKRAFNALDSATQSIALQKAQMLLNEESPTVFLVWQPFWFAARPEVQGLIPDASSSGTIWNSEAITIGASAP